MKKKTSRIFYNFDKFPTAVVGINQTGSNNSKSTKSKCDGNNHTPSNTPSKPTLIIDTAAKQGSGTPMEKKSPNIATNKSLNILNGMAFSRNINKSFVYKNYNI